MQPSPFVSNAQAYIRSWLRPQTQPTRSLLLSVDDLEAVLQDIAPVIGFDIETTGFEYPSRRMVGFSIYDPKHHRAYYIPIAHENYPNLPADKVWALFAPIADAVPLVAHRGAAFDILDIIRQGIQPACVLDSQILAHKLSLRLTGLKDLALDFGICNYQQIIRYEDLPIGSDNNFSHTNPADPKILTYVTNDAYQTFAVYQSLLAQLDSIVGCEIADIDMGVQFTQALTLSAASSRGYDIDSQRLEDFAKAYEADVVRLDVQLRHEVRTKLGWISPVESPSCLI